MSSPMRMKKGTGRSVNVVMDEKTPVTTPTRPGMPPRKKMAATMLTTRKAKAMGMLVRRRNTMPPKRRLMMSHHSIAYLPALILPIQS